MDSQEANINGGVRRWVRRRAMLPGPLARRLPAFSARSSAARTLRGVCRRKNAKVDVFVSILGASGMARADKTLRAMCCRTSYMRHTYGPRASRAPPLPRCACEGSSRWYPASPTDRREPNRRKPSGPPRRGCSTLDRDLLGFYPARRTRFASPRTMHPRQAFFHPMCTSDEQAGDPRANKRISPSSRLRIEGSVIVRRGALRDAYRARRTKPEGQPKQQSLLRFQEPGSRVSRHPHPLYRTTPHVAVARAR